MDDELHLSDEDLAALADLPGLDVLRGLVALNDEVREMIENGVPVADVLRAVVTICQRLRLDMNQARNRLH